jgi:tetratricopeptide (TPR) repeat protein
MTNPHARGYAAWVLALTVAAGPAAAASACKLGKIVELPVTMAGTRPLVSAKINGESVELLADTGAIFNMMSPANAAQFKLRLDPAPPNLRMYGINGAIETSVTKVKVFTLAGVDLHNIEFLVGGGEGGNGVAGVMGRNILLFKDVEFDLANGVLRLMSAVDCGHTSLAYWADASHQYSVVDLSYDNQAIPAVTATPLLNGQKIRALIDTGASYSLLTRKAAERAGVKIDSPGVVESGYSTGAGRHQIKTYVATFGSFKIGEEEIRNPRLRFGDIDLDYDMLLGADFFLSHRIYIARSSQRLFFTYNGGPVFNLSRSSAAPAPAPAPAAGSAAEPPPSTTAEPAAAAAAPAGRADPAAGAGEPTDASGFARRGAAFLARRDFTHALSDLARACELDPANADYLFQHGQALWQSSQSELAMADFNKAIEIKPDHVPSLLSRAQLRINAKQLPGAKSDLDAVDGIAAKQADLRLELARKYERAGFPGRAAAQYDIWIAAHSVDSKLADALSERCWVKALQGADLSNALGDCSDALRLSPKNSPLSARTLNGRGLVRLRLGDYAKAIADYDAALKIDPKLVAALYGRGVAKIRAKKNADGQADIDTAEKLAPKIAEQFQSRGIVP